jgi:CDP-4-dehydro-6-deoxyglucose reductase
MLHYIYSRNIPHQNLYLLFGVRSKKDLLYHAEMQQLSKDLQGFQYMPTLSREEWNGLSGYVHDIYKLQSQNKPAAEFMLCGWRAMIDEARMNLTALGYKKHQIHFELYG